MISSNASSYAARASIHRPSDPAALESEVIRLSASGLTARDVAQALGLSWIAVEQLVERSRRKAA